MLIATAYQENKKDLIMFAFIRFAFASVLFGAFSLFGAMATLAIIHYLA